MKTPDMTNEETTVTTTTSIPPGMPSTAPSPSRRAWIVAGSLFCVIALGYGVLGVVDLLSFDRGHFERTFSEPIKTLQISNGAGSVVVQGDSAGTVIVDGSTRRGLRAPNHRETVSGDRLTLDADCPSFLTDFCNLSYTVHVPPGVDVVIRASGGAVRLVDLTGTVDASSSGGSVRVTGASGALKLRSSGGSITGDGLQSASVDASSSGGGVKLTFAAPPTSVVANSSGGGVTVELPNTTDAYLLHASSSGGSVSTPVRTDPTSARVIDAHSSGGGVTVRYPK